jgi:hypothetical protein
VEAQAGANRANTRIINITRPNHFFIASLQILFLTGVYSALVDKKWMGILLIV